MEMPATAPAPNSLLFEDCSEFSDAPLDVGSPLDGTVPLEGNNEVGAWVTGAGVVKGKDVVVDVCEAT